MPTGILDDLAAPARPAVADRLRLLAMLIASAVAAGITHAEAARLAPLVLLVPLAVVNTEADQLGIQRNTGDSTSAA